MSDSEDTSSNDYNSSSEEESSSEDEIVLHKPIFLKRKGKDLDLNDSEREAKLLKPGNPNDSEPDQLLKRIDFENNQANKREEMASQITNDYTTDKDLLRRTILLDDDDTIDPEYEKQEWLKRKKNREKYQRDKLVAKQLEFETKEANKLKSKEISNKDLTSQNTNFNSEKTATHKTTDKNSKLDNSKKNYKPQVARDHNFGTSIGSKEDSKIENEYSIL
ncbi:similar to Saccharomyces cerevisiae YBR152W SPP381 mRNA splicing factor, component of U4/U6.U5 tri-snRNP [Maudiozyma saulgeensis]|uniref:Similar to Saccharomyces cerevisiae YBR152W SPP381 mRNA splicing factor, component of U4/U6.U5 tri-snRNP n=1 Tax=Maudiozyma saulgeensis TaxID=1789683 RepID=A0A1X7R1K3_9SACH|nr:similar to Saccharomyces cerevisiae YBR152W SPP381 mRNA splicing factor, component of U4/U6.U5 tri-snRNP [Kazachstania saulgeensis]